MEFAYSRQARKVFASAFLQRHMGMGPLGAWGIYIIDPDRNSSEQSGDVGFINLDELGIPTSDTNGEYNDTVINSGDNYTLNDSIPFNPVIGTNIERGLMADKWAPNTTLQPIVKLES